MMTDPIADALTRIRNALRIQREHVDMPTSRVRENLAACLKREGYIRGFEVLDGSPRKTLRVLLKYGPEGEDVIQRITRVSKPGRRVYSSVKDLKPVMNGLGISVLSTNAGIISDREARIKNTGGEILATLD